MYKVYNFGCYSDVDLHKAKHFLGTGFNPDFYIFYSFGHAELMMNNASLTLFIVVNVKGQGAEINKRAQGQQVTCGLVCIMDCVWQCAMCNIFPGCQA